MLNSLAIRTRAGYDYVRTRSVQEEPMVMRAARFEMRLKKDQKELLEQAAAVQGQDLTAFTLGVLLKEASDVLAQYRTRRVTERGMRAILRLLKNPPAPNAALKKAARRHAEEVRE